MEESKEYVIFTVTNKDGDEVTMAVTDEFEFEKKNYVVASVVKDDTVYEEESYIYKVKPGSEFDVDKITEPGEYERVTKAYMEIDA